MKYLPLGNTDIDVSVICLGCWGFAGDKMWGPQDDQHSIDTIHAALDAGINFLDTAEGYGGGYSEKIVGIALKGRRDQAIIATKVSPSHLSPDDLVTACENSLSRLQTDYIDLYQVHWPNRDIPFDETMTVLLKLKEQGKIRHIGVSNMGPTDLQTFLDIDHVESNQLAYSLLFRPVEYELQALCIENNVGILCYSSLMHGLLTGKYKSAENFPASRARTRHFSSSREHAVHSDVGYETETFAAIDAIGKISDEINHSMTEVAVAWLMYQPGVTSVISGARNTDQLNQIAKAADVYLDEETLKKLTQVTDPLKVALGNNLDMWYSDSRIR